VGAHINDDERMAGILSKDSAAKKFHSHYKSQLKK
jgi:hypothetical protein